MKKYLILIFLVLLMLHRPVLGGQPEKIVSLDLCTDWMLLKYASPGQVRAYSPFLYQYSNDWIEQGLPTHNGSLEQIVSLKPDLIISGEFNALLLRERLQQLNFGIEVMHNPGSLEDIDIYIQRFKYLLQAKSDLNANRLHQKNPSREQTLLLLGANGIGTGRDTLEHDIITAAGWENYLSLPGYTSLDLEKLLTKPPDAIFWTAPGSASLAAQFAQHRALRHKVSSSQWITNSSWRWQCPGPWTYSLIQELATWKNP